MFEVTSSIKDQLPNHIVENYETFTSFLEAYYEWLETGNNPYGFSKKFKKSFDLETSVDEFVNQFKKEYLSQFPESIITDKRKLIQYIKDFYSSKGTEKSIKFLFRVLFDESVSIYYPRDDILRVSDGKWVSNEVVLYTTYINDMTDAIFTSIVQERRANDEYRIGKGVIRDIQILYLGGYKTLKITVADVVGYFEAGYPLRIGTDKTEYPYTLSASLTIVDGGVDYTVGDIASIAPTVSSTYRNTIIKSAPVNGKIDFEVTTTFTESDVLVYVNDVALVDTEWSWDGRYLQLNEGSFVLADEIKISLPLYLGNYYVSAVDNTGKILKFETIDNPIGTTTALDVVVQSTAGSGENIVPVVGGARLIEGYYSNTDGHLSSDKVLQDSDYYQDFSYVIRTGMSLDLYADVIKSVAHPAGMKFFGEIFSIEELFFGFESFEDLFRILIPAFYTTYLEGGETLFATEFVGFHTGVTQRHRLLFPQTHIDESTPVSSIQDWSLQEINNDLKGLTINRKYTPFAGDFDADVETVYPITPTTGSLLYRVSVAGTVDGDVLAVDDFIRYNTETTEWDIVPITERQQIKVNFGPDIYIVVRIYGSTIDEIESAIRGAAAMVNYYGLNGIRTITVEESDLLIDSYI